jgi:hypothetical protein
MRYARWRLKSLLILVAALALVCAGAVKWKRYIELRERIANCSRQEKLLLAEYQQAVRPRYHCGNERLMAEAYLRVALERRSEIERCRREIMRIW